MQLESLLATTETTSANGSQPNYDRRIKLDVAVCILTCGYVRNQHICSGKFSSDSADSFHNCERQSSYGYIVCDTGKLNLQFLCGGKLGLDSDNL